MACLQIYEACKERGRIAYKRSGGSRLITHNEHWKSQIRHALYTSDRFIRCSAACETAVGVLAWTFGLDYIHVPFMRRYKCVLHAGHHACWLAETHARGLLSAVLHVARSCGRLEHACSPCSSLQLLVCRAPDAPDTWVVTAPYADIEPQMTKVLVRANTAGTMADDFADPPKRQKPPKAARGKHAAEDSPQPSRIKRPR